MEQGWAELGGRQATAHHPLWCVSHPTSGSAGTSELSSREGAGEVQSGRGPVLGVHPAAFCTHLHPHSPATHSGPCPALLLVEGTASGFSG